MKTHEYIRALHQRIALLEIIADYGEWTEEHRQARKDLSKLPSMHELADAYLETAYKDFGDILNSDLCKDTYYFKEE